MRGRLIRVARRIRLAPVAIVATAAILALVVAGCGSTSSPAATVVSTSPATASAGSTPTTATSAAPPTVAPAGKWLRTNPVAAPAVYSELLYAQCAGGPDPNGDCFADGFRQGQDGRLTNFLERWNGTSWTSTDQPGTSTSDASAPGELDCLNDGLCVVPIQSSTTRATLVSVRGTTWTLMPSDSASVDDLVHNSAQSVTCNTDTSCVAVSNLTNDSETHAEPLGMLWDGTQWKSMNIDTGNQDPVQEMSSVSCTSETFCMAVGFTATSPSDPGHDAITASWNGTNWTSVPSPIGTRLDDVVCASPTWCIAVGSDGTATGLSLLWDGHTWSRERLPSGTGPLYDVNCSAESMCMALQHPDPSHPLGTKAVELRWHGTWFAVTGYPAPAAGLSSVSCYTVTACLVVGFARSTRSTDANDVRGAHTTAAAYEVTGG